MKPLGKSVVTTDEQRESQEPMIADDTDDIRKIEKKRQKEQTCLTSKTTLANGLDIQQKRW